MSLLNLTLPDVLITSDWHELYSDHDSMNQAVMTEASDDISGHCELYNNPTSVILRKV
ncbi:hypothetical protein JHK87_009743 [Glycine soja]|nr:hypothetical protein JHK87_009743 [Glycine soja]